MTVAIDLTQILNETQVARDDIICAIYFQESRSSHKFPTIFKKIVDSKQQIQLLI